MRKAQGATEYLIILAVVVVIALILISVLGGIPGIGGGAGSRTSDAYWANQDIAIVSKAISAAGADTIIVKNNLKNSITLTTLSVNGVAVDSDNVLSAGQEATLSGAIAACTAGQGYSYTVVITYTDSATGASITPPIAEKLEGTCAA